MMHCQDFGYLCAESIDHAIVAKDQLADGRIVDFGDDSPHLRKMDQALRRLKDVHRKESRIVGRILRNEFGNGIEIVRRLGRPPHFNHWAILSLT